MNVLPYFPEPEVIPGNIADEQYDVRLRFIRIASVWHALSVVLVGLAAFILPFAFDLLPCAIALAGCLATLSLFRKLDARGSLDHLGSAIVGLVTLSMLGLLLAAANRTGFPAIEAFLATGIAMHGYTLICGRDLSFVGQFFLGALALAVAPSVARALGAISWVSLIEFILSAWALLAFWVYDLAALLTRRRKGEELQAAIDLYRDVLNFLSYSVRVVRHWRSIRL